VKLHRLTALCLAGALGWPLVMPVPLSRAESSKTDSAPAEASAPDRQTPPFPSEKAGQAFWQRAQRFLQAGDYAQALQALEDILRLTPDDSLASAYRALCRTRLKESEQVARFSVDDLSALQERLRRESQAQTAQASQAKMMEREIAKEQARWDQALKQAQREAIRTSRAQPRQAERPQPPVAVMPVPVAPVIVPTAPEPVPAVSAPVMPAPAVPPSMIELEPVPVPRPPVPPGAVQILADQMRVSQERRLAVAEGNVHVLFEDGVLTCDHMTLFTDTHDVYAEGRVRIERGAEVFRGELVHYNIDNKKGRFFQGDVATPPWYTHGLVSEHLAEGVMRVKSGGLTSCDLDPPHFRFQSRTATVFTTDKIVRGKNVVLFMEDLPLIYLPSLMVADRQTPFFLIPGKNSRWGQFVLGGYRYEWPQGQRGTVHLDWRRNFLWGTGLDHQFQSTSWGKGLFKAYYGQRYLRVQDPKATLPKGAAHKRYRILFRHQWQMLPDTTVVTNYQKYSDANFRKDFLFREEVVSESNPESYVSMITSDPHYTLSLLARRRINRFQTVTNALPQATLDVRPQPIGETAFFSSTKLDVANLDTKNAHSEIDTDVIRLDWFQKLSYAMHWFRPIEVTPNVGVRQTFYTKDKQGGPERPDGQRNLFSGQFSAGADASLKLFRLFPIATNVLGLNLHRLRHVVTPTISYSYVHRPTVPNELFSFPLAAGTTNGLTFGLENKLQTKRPISGGTGKSGQPEKLANVDLARLLLSVPYTFRGAGNKQGGRVGDTAVDLELYPWPWMRLESDFSYPSHFVKGSRDERVTAWNLDLVMVGGHGVPLAQHAPKIQAPTLRAFQVGPQTGLPLLPQGQWYLGLSHRYSYNDKTEDVLQLNWRLSEKWQIGTFHRFDWKEVAGGLKRFNNMREYQYTLTRDLHDWVGEFVYRVDREFGEELFFTLTLKAYPNMPIALSESYHEPKFGSQSSPFSPVPRGPQAIP